MNAERGRLSRRRASNAAVIFAAVRAGAPYGVARCPGAPVFIGAVPGYLFGGGDETQGGRAR
jgi:hypothetical protein